MTELVAKQELASSECKDANLLEPVRSGDVAAVARALEAGAQADDTDGSGLTPLLIASGLGHARIVEALVKFGANVNYVETLMGSTALHKAAQNGDPEIISVLIRHGSFIDQQSPVIGQTALMDAVVYKKAAAVDILLSHDARTSIRNHWGQSARDLAAEVGRKDLVDLIDARDEQDRKQTDALPIFAAIKTGDVEEVQRLIDAGAALESKLPMRGIPDDDYTPLGMAAREKRPEIIARLLDAGADPRQAFGLYRGTAVHEAAYFGFADIISVFAEFDRSRTESRIDWDARGAYNGMTPLHDAAWHGHLATVQALIAAGASPRTVSHTGETPADLARAYGYSAIHEFLQTVSDDDPQANDQEDDINVV